MTRTCIASVACIAAAAGMASAGPLFIFEQGAGSFSVTSSDNMGRTVEFDTNVIFEVGGLGILTIDGTFDQSYNGSNQDTFLGNALFTGASNADTLSVDFNGVIFDNGFESFSGVWTLTGSTGAYAQYTSGSGNQSGSFFFQDDTSGSMFVIFQGTLVPTPGTLAFAAIGSGMLCVRRRRA